MERDSSILHSQNIPPRTSVSIGQDRSEGQCSLAPETSEPVALAVEELPSTAKKRNAISTPFGLNRWVLVVIFMVIVQLSGNVYWGWAYGLREMLLRSSAYAWVCTGDEQGTTWNQERNSCVKQEAMVGRLLVLAYVSHFVLSVVGGTMLDVLGPKITCCIGYSIKMAGFAIFGCSTRGFQGYIPGIMLLAGSHDIAFLPFLTIVSYFDDYPAVVIALLGACKSSSASVPVVMNKIWETNLSGFSLKGIMLVYVGGILLPCVASAAILLPLKRKYKLELTKEERQPDDTRSKQYEVETLPTPCAPEDPTSATAPIRKSSTSSWLISVPEPALRKGSVATRRSSYVSVQDIVEIYDSTKDLVAGRNQARKRSEELKLPEVVQEHSQFTDTDFGDESEYLYNTKETGVEAERLDKAENRGERPERKPFCEVFRNPSYWLIIPFFCVALLRHLFFSQSAKEQLAGAYHIWGIASCFRFIFCIAMGVVSNQLGIFWALVLVNFIGLLMCLFGTINVLACNWIAVIMMLLYTSYCLTQLYTYVSATQDPWHFGKLTGIASLFAGLFQIVALPMFELSKTDLNDEFWPMDLLLVVLSIGNFIIIAILYWLERKQQRAATKQEGLAEERELAPVDREVSKTYIEGRPRLLSSLSARPSRKASDIIVDL